jgi:hypothetical protein
MCASCVDVGDDTRRIRSPEDLPRTHRWSPSQRRWRVARALSLDALIVQASTMSRPILETLGFEATADLIAIIDTPAPDKRSTTSPTG